MKKGIAKGGDHETVPARQFMLLFYLVKFLPDSLSGYILRKKLYRFLPKLSPMTLCILERIFNRAKYDLNVSRTKARYFYFILCRIFCP